MGLFDRQKIDEEAWEELEELLISADVGVATTGKLIDVALLREDEITWIDAYHQRVFEALGDQVDEETRRWLEQATRPLDRIQL